MISGIGVMGEGERWRHCLALWISSRRSPNSNVTAISGHSLRQPHAFIMSACYSHIPSNLGESILYSPHFLKILSSGGGGRRERSTYIGDPIARLDLIWEPYVLHHRLRFMAEIILCILRFFSPPQQKTHTSNSTCKQKNSPKICCSPHVEKERA